MRRRFNLPTTIAPDSFQVSAVLDAGARTGIGAGRLHGLGRPIRAWVAELLSGSPCHPSYGKQLSCSGGRPQRLGPGLLTQTLLAGIVALCREFQHSLLRLSDITTSMTEASPI